jgi:uncharacterized protein YjbI with pentapeptide repeats
MLLDFSGQNLRGRNFEGNLSGANFSGADIRGASFSNANLKGANFTKAKAGLQKRWAIVLLILLLVLSIASGVLLGINALTSLLYIFPENGIPDFTSNPVTGISIFLICAIFFYITIRYGITTVAWFFLVSASVTSILGTIFGNTFANVAGTFLNTAGISTAIIFTVGTAEIIVKGIAGRIASIVIFLTSIILIYQVTIFSVNIPIGKAAVIFIASTVAFILVSLNSYISFQALKGNEKFALIRSFAVVFGTIKATSFRGADLTVANFTQATLANSDLRNAKLTHTRWVSVGQLERGRLGNSYLANSKIRQLVVTLSGQDQNYNGLNLEGVNLQGANLQDAKFAGSNLNYANLQDANLSRATLKQAQLDETNLTGAILTGAYIEDWGITGATDLTDVQCEYVFMRVPTKEDPNPLRKPDNLRESFADGEFADFIQPYVDTLDLYHSQNIDPRAISIAFKNLSQNHPEADLEIVAMEKRGQSSFNLKVRTAPTANKSELSAEYFDDYNRLKTLPEARLLLLEKDDRIRNLEQMINTALNQPNFNIQNVQGDIMSEQNRNVNVGGDLNLSGSTLNLGEISGTVANAINQLPDRLDPDQPNLKHLLMELQTAIETEPNLLEKGKASALEQVNVLAEVAQTGVRICGGVPK